MAPGTRRDRASGPDEPLRHFVGCLTTGRSPAPRSSSRRGHGRHLPRRHDRLRAARLRGALGFRQGRDGGCRSREAASAGGLHAAPCSARPIASGTPVYARRSSRLARRRSATSSCARRGRRQRALSAARPGRRAAGDSVARRSARQPCAQRRGQSGVSGQTMRSRWLGVPRALTAARACVRSGSRGRSSNRVARLAAPYSKSSVGGRSGCLEALVGGRRVGERRSVPVRSRAASTLPSASSRRKCCALRFSVQRT